MSSSGILTHLLFERSKGLCPRSRTSRLSELKDCSKRKRGIRKYDVTYGEMGDIPNLIREVGGCIGTPIFFAVAVP